MKILITGGTGFIGRQLIRALSQGNQLTLLTRSAGKAHLENEGHHKLISNLNGLTSLDGYDAVINLAGEPIADRRWTLVQKQKICYSRWDITEKLSQLIKVSKQPPSVFISGSAIGIYGNHDRNSPLDEHFNLAHFSETGQEEKFAHSVCSRWEELALNAESDTRVCIIRIGIVLGLTGGALKKMLVPFKLGAGGTIGSGTQGMSWIHQQDLINIILFLLKNPESQGIYNATAPHPVSNKEFTLALGKALHRPTILPVPGPMLNLMLGELSELLLEGQYIYPKRLIEAGYQFCYSELEQALTELFAKQAA